jgi:hypothetical protein
MWIELHKRENNAIVPLLVNSDNIEEIEPIKGSAGCKLTFGNGRVVMVTELSTFFPVATMNSGKLDIKSTKAVDGVDDEKVIEMIEGIILNHVRVPNSKLKQTMHQMIDDKLSKLAEDKPKVATKADEPKAKETLTLPGKNRMTTSAI